MMRWRGLRRSGSGSGVSAPPDPADSPPVAASPARGAARGEQPGGPAVRRGRRRRRLLIAAPFLVVLVWAVVSYTTWMLQPTSLSWQVNSVEWVRHNVPFGNWLADTSERIYYTRNAPKKGGPPLKSLPADFTCYAVETEFWGAMASPRLPPMAWIDTTSPRRRGNLRASSGMAVGCQRLLPMPTSAAQTSSIQ